jgi:O-antigen ligase
VAPHTIIQAGLVFIILMYFGALFYQNYTWAWYFVLAELFLGGTGHFLGFFGLSIRTILLVTFLIFWLVHNAYKGNHQKLKVPHHLFYILVALGIWILVAGLIGITQGNSILAVIQDLVPYAFFALLLPSYHILHKKIGRDFIVRLIIAFIIGSALFSMFTFILFTTGTEVIHGEFYNWYRDVVAGKITDMGTGFFRIVAPEHLLLVPLLLLLVSLISRKENHHTWWYLLIFLSVTTLTLNLSRTYFLAIILGLIVLKYKHHLLRWLTVTAGTIFLFFAIFTTTHMLVSGGSTGWNLISNRLASISTPTLEKSTYTRVALLEPIGELIRSAPILGSGLGSTLTFWDKDNNQNITTNQFDWGYLELWVEIGGIGLLLFLVLLGMIIYSLVEIIRHVEDYHDFHVGILAGLVALIIMNITAPILFHVLGVFVLVLIIVVAIHHHSLLDKIISALYQVFRKK